MLWLEIVNVAARRWGFTRAKLKELAKSLSSLGFEPLEPDIAAVARWAAQGLTAYDAAYVAVAEHSSTQLITDDDQILRVVPKLTTALALTAEPTERAPDQPTEDP